MRRSLFGGIASVLGALLSFVGCAATVGSGTSARRSTGLSEVDVAALAAVIAAADARRVDTSAIDAGLRSTTPVVRASSVRAIGQIGIAARAGVARLLLADPDTMVAADAAFALGSMRDSAAAATLANALSYAPTVVAAAAWSLGELGPAGRSALENALRAGSPASAIPEVLLAATKLRPVPVALITPFLEHPALPVRRGAAYALTRTRLPPAVRPLLAAARRLTPASRTPNANVPDTAADLRSYIARGLAQPATGDSLASPALAALRTLAADPHPHVRINAARSLATFGPTARADVLGLVRDPDANVRVAVAQVLGDVVAADRAAWMAAWMADTSLTYRRTLLAPALRAGVRLPALDARTPESWITHRDWPFRAAVAQTAVGATLADIDALAAPLMRDPDGRVRSAAFAAAASWADSSAAGGKSYSRSALIGAIGDTDIYVRATILNALRARARAVDVPFAIEALRRASGDVENDARIAALRTIAAAWRTDSASFSSALRDSLFRLPPPTDAAERTLGRTMSPLQHWPAASRVERPIEWYARQVREYVGRTVAGRPLTAKIVTTRGTVTISFYGADAPLTVANFALLARRGYFDGSVFHRVVPNFVAQDGDPRGDGSGGPGYAIRDELNRRWYDRGAVGMALSGPDTGGSQYFLTHSPQPHLDGHYTVFGHVVEGFAVLDGIVQGDRIVTVTVQ